MDRLLYRVTEAAEALGISRSKVYELIKAGRLPAVHIDGACRIKASALHDYVANLGLESRAA